MALYDVFAVLDCTKNQLIIVFMWQLSVVDKGFGGHYSAS